LAKLNFRKMGWDMEVVRPRAKTAPAPKGLRPESSLALSLALPISTYWLRLASRHRQFWLAPHARFIMFQTPRTQKPGELALAGSEKTCNVFSLAGFVTRPQAEYQIGAA